MKIRRGFSFENFGRFNKMITTENKEIRADDSSKKKDLSLPVCSIKNISGKTSIFPY